MLINNIIFVDPPQKCFNMKNFQLYIIEITVHVLSIMTSNLAIATSLLVLQRYLSAIRHHTDSFENTV